MIYFVHEFYFDRIVRNVYFGNIKKCECDSFDILIMIFDVVKVVGKY